MERLNFLVSQGESYYQFTTSTKDMVAAMSGLIELFNEVIKLGG